MKIQPFTHTPPLFQPSSSRNTTTSPQASESAFTKHLSLTAEDSSALITSGDSLTQPIGGNEIDYKNAQPIPMPSLPDAAPLENLPAPSSPSEIRGRSGSAPGNRGTGEENPEIVIPQKSPADPDPVSETSVANKYSSLRIIMQNNLRYLPVPSFPK